LKERPLPIIEGSANVKWDWQIEGGLFGGAGILLHDDGVNSWVRVEPITSSFAKSFILFAVLCMILTAVAGAWPIAALFAVWNFVLAHRIAIHQGEALAVLSALLAENEIHKTSLWSQFVPPRHFFEEPSRDNSCRNVS
jgi:hypothetical protein